MNAWMFGVWGGKADNHEFTIDTDLWLATTHSLGSQMCWWLSLNLFAMYRVDAPVLLDLKTAEIIL